MKNYYTVKEFREYVLKHHDVIYSYGLMSALYPFTITKKGIVAFDSLDNKVLFNNHHNKDYKFYKDCISCINSEG